MLCTTCNCLKEYYTMIVSGHLDTYKVKWKRFSEYQKRVKLPHVISTPNDMAVASTLSSKRSLNKRASCTWSSVKNQHD